MRNTTPDPEILAAVAGPYQFGPDFYRANGSVSVSVKDGQLFDGDWWLMPTSHGELTFQHRRYWSVLEFHRDASGQVDRVRYDGYVGHRTNSPWAWFRSLF